MNSCRVLALVCLLGVVAGQYDPEPASPYAHTLVNPYDSVVDEGESTPLHLQDGIGEDLLLAKPQVHPHTRYLSSGPRDRLAPPRTRHGIHNEFSRSGDYRTDYDGFPQDKGGHGFFEDKFKEKEHFVPRHLSDDPWNPPAIVEHPVRDRDTPAGLAFKREDFALPPNPNDGYKLSIHNDWVKAPLENKKPPQPPPAPPQPPVDRHNDIYAQNENDPVDWDKKTLKKLAELHAEQKAHTLSGNIVKHSPRSIYRDPLPLPEAERVKYPAYIREGEDWSQDPTGAVEAIDPHGGQYKPIGGGHDRRGDPYFTPGGTSRAVRKVGVPMKEDLPEGLPKDNAYNVLPADMTARGSTGVATQAPMDEYKENHVDASRNGPPLVYGGPEAKKAEEAWRQPPKTDGVPLEPSQRF